MKDNESLKVPLTDCPKTKYKIVYFEDGSVIGMVENHKYLKEMSDDMGG